MPVRPKQPLRKKTKSGLSEVDLEYLLRGYVMLTGYEANFRTNAEAGMAYKQNKSYIFSLIGKYTDRHPERGLRWGERPWAFYRFNFSEDYSELYQHFRECWGSEEMRDTEFEFLKDEDLLIKYEEKNFRLQEKRHKEFKESLRHVEKPKNIVEFPKK